MGELIKNYRDGFNPNPISSPEKQQETSAFGTIILISFLIVTLLGVHYLEKKEIKKAEL